ncbi:MAG: GNAT family N-acetyltransferase [Candidatus Sphingomonas colombiensis]|nr:GNAT family N-acetyltransferase [Sphingomonas sp.]WEK44235.1 MAG: GNAT family N-acetyltransferase [Sphingomonas sp.]
MPFLIRRAVAEDASALTALMHASAAYSGRYASILDGYALTPDQVARDRVFLAVGENVVAGFYSLTLVGEPELDLMFIADSAQGNGLGALLFDHMKEEARRMAVKTIRIVSHPPSAGFYKRMGAIAAGVYPPTAKAPWERPILRLVV